jgi:hypothetical protein
MSQIRVSASADYRACGICLHTAPNTSVLKPFEQIVGELIRGRRNKVFQVVTSVACGKREISERLLSYF